MLALEQKNIKFDPHFEKCLNNWAEGKSLVLRKELMTKPGFQQHAATVKSLLLNRFLCHALCVMVVGNMPTYLHSNHCINEKHHDD